MDDCQQAADGSTTMKEGAPCRHEANRDSNGAIDYEMVLEWIGTKLAKVRFDRGQTGCVPAWMVRSQQSVDAQNINESHSVTKEQTTDIHGTSTVITSEASGTGATCEDSRNNSVTETVSQVTPRTTITTTETTSSVSVPEKKQRKQQRKQESTSEKTVEGDMDVDCAETTDISGTLRWKMNFEFPRLPMINSEKGAGVVMSFYQQMMTTHSQHVGWASWLNARLPGVDPSKIIQSDTNRCVQVSREKHVQFHPALLDAMSFPLTLGHALYSSPDVVSHLEASTLYILIAGASYKAEQRLLDRSNCYEELRYILQPLSRKIGCRRINLLFVGPEVKYKPEYQIASSYSDLPELRATCSRGKIENFLKQKTVLTESNCICVGYNCGFGNRNTEMRQSWLPSLKALLDRRLYCVFTSVNYSEDLKGELIVMQKLLHANFVLKAQQNPFHMASTFIQESHSAQASETCCGNSYLYAVSGRSAEV